MNFVGEDPKGDQMKELHWKYGYLMFWVVGGAGGSERRTHMCG
jgi:hypothetical protein